MCILILCIVILHSMHGCLFSYRITVKLSVNDSVEDSEEALEGEQQDETQGSQVSVFGSLMMSCISFFITGT